MYLHNGGKSVCVSSFGQHLKNSTNTFVMFMKMELNLKA